MSPSLSPLDHQLLGALRLGDGQPVSGKAIGLALSVSRAAVWKRIEGLRKVGYRIDSVPRRGYVLTLEPDTPTPEAVGPLLDHSTRQHGLFAQEKIHFFETLDSTNIQAGILARAGALDGTVVVADHQSQGKGRLGRSWDSPSGLNLYFSLILRPDIYPRHAAQLTLLTGLALAEVVQAVGGEAVQIKWPNDLLLGGRKLAGILTEMAVEADRIQFVVVGVGVNLNASVSDLSPELAQIATTLSDYLSQDSTVVGASQRQSSDSPGCTKKSFSPHSTSGIATITSDKSDGCAYGIGATPEFTLKKTVKRSRFLADFLNRFDGWYHRYLTGGFAPIRSIWLERSAISGRKVRINLFQESFTAWAVDLDSEGFLTVKREDTGEETRVLAGDVFLLDS
ncbi:MAG: biotin--[acetyl-CoA-carboxylase] ligase [Magnetococcales bacterium]|nr:biotin--[acetyl-CoA-carboxylase] ligase [Magnetococcales bacterium]